MNIFGKNSKPIPVIILFCLSILFSRCSQKNGVSLRKFPYPYQSALAICSDIDQTGSFEEFSAIQQFLNDSNQTIYGKGLGLEIGNSYWLYNDSYDPIINPEDSLLPKDTGISLYFGTTDSPNSYAERLKKLIRSGYVDCFHSYGHFGRERFNRELAEQAISLIKKESLSVDVYINHGKSGTNFQNIGDASWCKGDNIGSSYYHTDLTIPTGIKFFWRGQLTHCIGQDGDFSILNTLKQIYEYFQDIQYKELDFKHDNELVHLYELDDGNRLFEFCRFINPWGKYPDAVENNFAKQLGFSQVDQLINNKGYMIFYTHFGRNSGAPYLTDLTINALRYIKEKQNSRQLLVTTTSKLLNYYVHHKYLYWHSRKKADTTFIHIDSIANEVEGCFIPTEKQLEGMTFYYPEGNKVRLYSGDKLIPVVYNKPDESGQLSVSVAWQPLVLPPGIFETTTISEMDSLD